MVATWAAVFRTHRAHRARLLESPDHLPPPPAIAPASADWLVCNARSLLLDRSLILRPASAGSTSGVAMAAATVPAAVVVVKVIGEYLRVEVVVGVDEVLRPP